MPQQIVEKRIADLKRSSDERRGTPIAGAVSLDISRYLSALGKKGGKKGGKKTASLLTPAERAQKASKAGKAAASSMTPAERRERASTAAQARWGKLKKAPRSRGSRSKKEP